MLILVGVTVTGAINGGLIGTSQEAKYKTQISQIKEALEEEIINRKALKEPTDNITIADLDISNKLKEKYQNKLEITNREIYYIPYEIENGEETKWLEDMNIMANTIFFEYNGARITGFSQKGYEAIAKGTTKFVMPTRTNDGTEITTIGTNAFDATVEGKESCTKITSFTFPNTLKTIETGAFTGCTNIKKMDLSNTKITTTANIPSCTSLEEVILPEGVTEITYFANCKNLRKINIPNSVKSWASAGTFEGLSSLETVGKVGEMTWIRAYTFVNCNNLKNIELPDTITSISEGAFNGCGKLSLSKLPASLKKIGFCAFAGCAFGEELIIPEGVTSIGYLAFGGCNKVRKIVIPKSVTTLGTRAFFNTSKDCEVYVPFTEEEGAPERLG